MGIDRVRGTCAVHVLDDVRGGQSQRLGHPRRRSEQLVRNTGCHGGVGLENLGVTLRKNHSGGDVERPVSDRKTLSQPSQIKINMEVDRALEQRSVLNGLPLRDATAGGLRDAAPAPVAVEDRCHGGRHMRRLDLQRCRNNPSMLALT